MSSFFIDSNICVYAFDKTNDLKREKAFELMSKTPYLSSQVIIETYNACKRKLKLPVEVCEENTLFLCDIANVFAINAEVIKKAVSYQKTYLLSFLDACIVSSAIHADCSILYSEDLHNNLVVDNSLIIVNPFI